MINKAKGTPPVPTSRFLFTAWHNPQPCCGQGLHTSLPTGHGHCVEWHSRDGASAFPAEALDSLAGLRESAAGQQMDRSTGREGLRELRVAVAQAQTTVL